MTLILGINDIGNSPNATPIAAEELIAGYRQLIARAHVKGIAIHGATLTPFEGAGYYSPEKEAVRQAVNNWIRAFERPGVSGDGECGAAGVVSLFGGGLFEGCAETGAIKRSSKVVLAKAGLRGDDCMLTSCHSCDSATPPSHAAPKNHRGFRHRPGRHPGRRRSAGCRHPGSGCCRRSCGSSSRHGAPLPN
jgi:hypothetical protein